MNSLKESHKEFIKNNKLMLKSQQRFRREKHKIFDEEVNKIVLRASNDTRMQQIDSIETYACGTTNDLKKKKLNVKM